MNYAVLGVGFVVLATISNIVLIRPLSNKIKLFLIKMFTGLSALSFITLLSNILVGSYNTKALSFLGVLHYGRTSVGVFGNLVLLFGLITLFESVVLRLHYFTKLDLKASTASVEEDMSHTPEKSDILSKSEPTQELESEHLKSSEVDNSQPSTTSVEDIQPLPSLKEILTENISEESKVESISENRGNTETIHLDTMEFNYESENSSMESTDSVKVNEADLAEVLENDKTTEFITYKFCSFCGINLSSEEEICPFCSKELDVKYHRLGDSMI